MHHLCYRNIICFLENLRMSHTFSPHRKVFHYDSNFGYRFQPAITARIPHEGGGYLVKTNSQGFRCRHEVTRKKVKRNRILVFGDSYTAGDGVSNNQRFTDEMEFLLDDTEIMNFGLSGTGTDQQNLVYNHFAPQIDHDLTILVLQLENIKRNVISQRFWKDRTGVNLCVPKPWFELDYQDKLIVKGIPVNKPYLVSNPETEYNLFSSMFFRRWLNQGDRKLKNIIQKAARYQPLPEYKSPNNKAWLITKAILKDIIVKSKQPVIIVLLPVYQYVEKTASYAYIRQRFDAFEKEDKSILVHHVIDDMLKYPLKDRMSFRFKIDDHPTPGAHKVIGRSVADAVRPLLEKIQ